MFSTITTLCPNPNSKSLTLINRYYGRTLRLTEDSFFSAHFAFIFHTISLSFCFYYYYLLIIILINYLQFFQLDLPFLSFFLSFFLSEDFYSTKTLYSAVSFTSHHYQSAVKVLSIKVKVRRNS